MHRLFKKAETWLKRQTSLGDLTSGLVEEWILGLRADLERKAREDSAVLRDYSSTVLLAIVGRTEAIYAQIGDGAIVISTGDEEYSVVFWPENGEYANMTYFITDDDCKKHLQVQRTSSSPWELALLTDGLQRIALKYDTKTAFSPFFIPMSKTLRNKPPGMSYVLCDALSGFLNSSAINERTDDDKTLLLASRKPN